MNAETLRKAAALMRERASLALDTETSGPWYGQGGMTDLSGGHIRPEDDEYMVSWHPAVALAVADWLDMFAEVLTDDPAAEQLYHVEVDCALAVARAYLGGDA